MSDKEVKISEILHLAADKYLWEGVGMFGNKRDYSCHAIMAAVVFTMRARNWSDLDMPGTPGGAMWKRIKVGLRKLGLKPDSGSAFSRFAYGKERQQARYDWLKLCAMLAEEQGQ